MSLFQAARSVIQTLLGVWLFNDLFTTYVLLFIYCLQAFRFLSRLPLQSTSFLPPLYMQHTMLTRDLFRPFLQQSRAVHLDHRSGNYVLYMGKVPRVCTSRSSSRCSASGPCRRGERRDHRAPVICICSETLNVWTCHTCITVH